MNGRPVPWPLVVAIALCPAGGLIAQAPPNIDDLLGKTVLAADDRERIGLWIADRLDQIKAAVEAGDADRVSGTVREILAKANRASPGFQDALAEQTAELASAMLTNGEPVLSRTLADLLRKLDHVNTVDGLFTALQSGDVLTRYFAAGGLRNLAGRIDLTAARVLNQLEQAANTEPHPVVRQRILEAMLLPHRLDESLTAVHNSLMSALTRISDAAAPELSPEHRLLELLADPATGVKDADQRSRAELVAALAAVLVKAVERYAGAGGDRTAMELLIFYGESALGAAVREEITSKLPEITTAMKTGGPNATANMRAELLKWVGDKQTKGILNAAPWNVPIGGLPEQSPTP